MHPQTRRDVAELRAGAAGARLGAVVRGVRRHLEAWLHLELGDLAAALRVEAVYCKGIKYSLQLPG